MQYGKPAANEANIIPHTSVDGLLQSNAIFDEISDY